MQHQATQPITRRDLLLRSGGGFGALALAYLLRDNPLFADAPPRI